MATRHIHYLIEHHTMKT